jgi:4-hydroxy-tetrahydrodipicolinate synthase
MPTSLTGLWPPASTPFRANGAVDHDRLVKHCRTLLAEGASGLAVLGTTSEANSLTLDERRGAIEALIAAGIPAEKLLPGTGACAVDDAVALSRYAAELGCAGVLLLPPFYYKNVSDDGLFAFMASVIERCGARAPKILLYHFPQMAAAGWSVPLTGRLIKAFPGVVVGMKDSSGSADNTKAVIDAYPGFAVFPGAEVYLLSALKWGAVGCISATANINAHGIAQLIVHQHDADAPARQEDLVAIRKSFDGFVTVPAVKAVIAAKYRDAEWNRVRAPIMPLTETERSALLGKAPIARLLETVAA